MQKPRRSGAIPDFENLTYVENWRRPNGSVYTGEIRDGKAHGSGRVVFRKGTIIRGEFRDNLAHGRVVEMLIDGTIYEGEFSYGRRDGNGILSEPEEPLRVAQFMSGEIDGWGFVADGSNVVYTNRWICGKRVLSLDDPRIAAFYPEPRTLERPQSQAHPIPDPTSSPASQSISGTNDATSSTQDVTQDLPRAPRLPSRCDTNPAPALLEDQIPSRSGSEIPQDTPQTSSLSATEFRAHDYDMKRPSDN